MSFLNEMSEKERAAYYQDHKDSADLEEVPSPVIEGKRPRLSASITVRFSPEEAGIIRRAAQASGSSYSDIIRSAIRQLAVPQYHVHAFQFAFAERTNTGTFFTDSTVKTTPSMSQTGRLAKML